MAAPDFWIIAGPNGAGKTTLMRRGQPTPDMHPVIERFASAVLDEMKAVGRRSEIEN